MTDTTATYQQLQLQIVKPGCPICALREAAVETYLDTLLWESSTDFNLYDMLDASLGFCGRHSRQLLTFGGQRLAAAVVERASLLAAIRRLPQIATASEGLSSGRRSVRQLWARSKEPPAQSTLSPHLAPCPACVRQSAEDVRVLEVLLRHLDEFAVPLQKAGGLCLPHFSQITHLANATQRATLLRIQQQVWDDLAQNLEEFIRKQMDHHHQDPISEPGRLALERTIAALTGEFPVR
jgi:hypothetical protein